MKAELRRYLPLIVLAALALCLAASLKVSSDFFGASILTTNSSDTLTTFRTNVNTSLQNLNTDRISTSSTPTQGQLAYWTGLTTLGTTATGTLTASSPLSLSGTTVILGSSRTLTIDTSGLATFGFPFTPTTNYGVTANATSTRVWFQTGLFASSTSHFAQASTTQFSVTSAATSTFAGDIKLTSGVGHIVAHGAQGDGSDGFHIDSNATGGPQVCNFGAAGTANVSCYGGFNIDGTTRLATSLTGILKASSGTISVATAGTDYASFSWPFTPSSFGTQSVSATSSPLQVTSSSLGFIASSTSWLDNLRSINASTTGTLAIPIGASVITPIAGNLAIDTTTGQLRYSDVTSTTRVLVPDFDKSLSNWASSTPSGLDYTTYGAGTTTIEQFEPSRAVHLSSIYCKSTNGSMIVVFGTGSASTTSAYCTPSGNTTTVNQAFTARQTVFVAAGSATTSPKTNNITVTSTWTYDSD